jgi:Tfp pilus assembly protein PilX
MSLAAPARDERGIVLVMALGVLLVLSIVGMAIALHAVSSTHNSAYSAQEQTAFALAESGVNDALSVLAANVPTNGALLPETSCSPSGSSFACSTTLSLSNGGFAFAGSYDAVNRIWTITSTGQTRNPDGAAIKKTVVRTVQVTDAASGPLAAAWNRVYSDDATSACGMTINDIVVAVPVTARGNLCLNDDSKTPGVAQLTGSTVEVGGNATLQANTSIGSSSGTTVETARIGGGCKYGSQSSHAPCQGATDHVWASNLVTGAFTASRPTVDFAYWSTHADLGPSNKCTGADKSGAYAPDFSTAAFELTQDPGAGPGSKASSSSSLDAVSYTCRTRDANGNVAGELSWDATNRVLTVKGTIYFPGDAYFHDHAGTPSSHPANYVVHYQGRATIYVAGNWHNDEEVCAGGSGTNGCRSSISSWDPTQNLLTFVAGGSKSPGNNDFDFHMDSAFQGVLYALNDCKIREGAMLSGPVLCNTMNVDPNGTATTLNPWPALGSLLPGQTYGTPPTAADYRLVVGQQSG